MTGRRAFKRIVPALTSRTKAGASWFPIREQATHDADATFDAFISYSHGGDHRVAPALHAQLQSFGKPWYRRRSLRVFRDTANLGAHPELWPVIERALQNSRFLILLISPEAAVSRWVKREAEWWKAHREVDSVLLAVTRGRLQWDLTTSDFSKSAPVPPPLRRWFRSEPLWVDLTWVASDEDVSRRNPRMTECVASLAAAIWNVDKDALIGEDIRQHRRAMRLARTAVAALIAFGFIATTAGIVATDQRNTAREQRDLARSREFAALSANRLRAAPQEALQLATEGFELEPTIESKRALRLAMAQPLRRTHPADASLLARGPGGSVVLGHPDGRVTVWSGGLGTLKRVLQHTEGLAAIAVGRNGTIVTAATDGRILLWPPRGKEAQELRSVGGVHTIALSPAGVVVIGGIAGGLASVSTTRSDVIRRRTHGTFNVSVAALADGSVATLGNDGKLRRWDAATLRQLNAISVDDFAASKVEAAPSDSVLVTGYGRLRMFPANWRRPPLDLRAGDDLVSATRTSTGTIVAGTAGGGILVWDNPRTSCTGCPAPVTRVLLPSDSVPVKPAVVAAGDDGLVVSLSHDGVVRTWDVRRGEPPRVYDSRGRVLGLAATEKGMLAVGTDTGRLFLWDSVRQRVVAETSDSVGGVYSVGFARDGGIVHTSPDGTLRVWRPRVRRSRILARGIVAAAVGSQGIIAGGGRGGLVHVWPDYRDPPQVLQQPSGIEAIAVAPDGALATADDEGVIRVWEQPLRDTPRLSRQDGAITALALGADGRVVSGAEDGSVRVWRQDGGTGPTTLLHGSRVNAVAVGPSGTIASAGDDGAVRLWDPALDGERRDFSRGGIVTSVAFVSDKVIASGNDRGELALWTCNTCGPIASVYAAAKDELGR